MADRVAPPSGETPSPDALLANLNDLPDDLRVFVSVGALRAALRGEPSPDPVREAAQRVLQDYDERVHIYGEGCPARAAVMAALRDALGEPHPQPEKRTQ